MKRNFFLLFSMALMATALTFTSCDDDPCKDVECGDHGSCFDGDCVCDVGYEEDAEGQCTVEERAKFIGTWRVMEICTDPGDGMTFNATFNIIIAQKSDDIERVTIQSFANSTATSIISAKVSGTAFTIDSGQVIFDNMTGTDYEVVSASATMVGDDLELEYDLAAPGGDVEFNCTATAEKL